MTTDVDAFFEHHGVKGMRWGVHREPTGPRNKRIDEARARVKSGQTLDDIKKARAAYNTNKSDPAAKSALRDAKRKHRRDVNTANLAKSGREKATQVLLLTGALVAMHVLSSKSSVKSSGASAAAKMLTAAGEQEWWAGGFE